MAEQSMPVEVTRDGALAIVSIDNPPVNASSHAVRQGLSDTIRETSSDPEVRAVVLCCPGRTSVPGGIVAKRSDIDAVMVNGYGFPRWRGEPMFMAGET